MITGSVLGSGGLSQTGGIAAHMAGASQPQQVAAPAAFSSTGVNLSGTLWGQPLLMYIGMIVLLVGFKFLSEHPASELEPAHLHIGGYNVLAVTVTAIIGIVGLKMLMGIVPIPGLYQVVNAA